LTSALFACLVGFSGIFRTGFARASTPDFAASRAAITFAHAIHLLNDNYDK
jgi:hypothetical protein